jgi:AmmeMemoRadiSam system protein B
MKKKIMMFSLLLLIVIMAVAWLGFTIYGSRETALSEGKERHQAEPSELAFYEKAFAFLSKGPVQAPLSGQAVAGVVPHHLLAADIIARFYEGLRKEDPEIILLLGPNHYDQGDTAVLTSDLDWATPFGDLETDNDFVGRLRVSFGPIASDRTVIAKEHALTSQVAFIRQAFPQARLVPLILKPSLSESEAIRLAQSISAVVGQKKALLIISADFSHYKDSDTAQAEDKASIAILETMDKEKISSMAVDTPASIQVLMEYASAKGATFQLRENSNSAILSGQKDIKSTTSYVSGYYIGN